MSDIYAQLCTSVIETMMGNLVFKAQSFAEQDILKTIHQFENLLANPDQFFLTVTNAEQMLFVRNLMVFQIAEAKITYTFDWCSVKFEPTNVGKLIIIKLFTERKIKPKCSPKYEMLIPIDKILNIEQEDEDD